MSDAARAIAPPADTRRIRRNGTEPHVALDSQLRSFGWCCALDTLASMKANMPDGVDDRSDWGGGPIGGRSRI